jgi:hypothetical protein
MLRRDYPPIGAYGWPPPPLSQVRARWLRWLGLTAVVAAVLALVAFVIDHDDPRQPGLSDRAWLTLAAAAVLLVALGLHYRRGGLALLRAMSEYAVVALLAVLLTLTALPAPPAEQSAANRPRPPANRPAATPAGPQAKGAGAGCPAVVQVPAWLACLWHQANPPEPAAPSTRRTP